MNFVGAVSGIALTGLYRIILWLLLIAAFFMIGRLRARSQALLSSAPISTSPFDHKWQALALILIMVVTAVLTYIPLRNYYEPAAISAEGHIGGRFRITVDDWEKHIPTVTALLIDDHLPPANPYLSTDPYLRYYYFSYILPATVSNLFDGLIRGANSLVGQTVLIAAAFPALLYFYSREIKLTSNAALMVVALFMLVSGLDFFYMLKQYQQTGMWPGHIKIWDQLFNPPVRVRSATLSLIWTPQHSLGTFACVIILRQIHQLTAIASDRVSGLVLTTQLAVMLAALLGTSSLVWLPLVVGLGFYVLLEFFRRYVLHQKNLVWGLVIALGLSLLLSIPFLKVTTGTQQTIRLLITPSPPGIEFGSVVSALLGPSTAAYIADFPFQLIPNYGIVIFTGIAGLWLLRSTWNESAHLRLWTVLLMTGVMIMLAFRSEAGFVNDLALNASGPVWLIFGIASGFWWSARSQSLLWRWKPARLMLSVPLILGLATSVYEPYMLWTRSQYQYSSDDHMEIFDWLNTHLERDEVYQTNYQWLWYRHDPLTFVERRTLLLDTTYARLYTDAYLFFSTGYMVLDAYAATSAIEASRLFTSINIDYIIIQRDEAFGALADPIFSRYFSLAFETPMFRIFRVGKPD